MKGRLSDTHLSSESNLPIFQLNAPNVIRPKEKKKASMTTRAFSRNIGKLFSELKLVPDNLAFIYYYDVHCNSVEASRFQLDDVSWLADEGWAPGGSRMLAKLNTVNFYS